jgi:hypothetical protein
VLSCGSCVGITEAPKDFQLIVVWCSAEEQFKGSLVLTRATRPAIKQVGSSGERIWPEGSGHGRMEQDRAHAVVYGAKHAPGTSILLRCVRASQAQYNAVSGKERPGCRVVELAAIVHLKAHDGQLELCSCKSMKGYERG